MRGTTYVFDVAHNPAGAEVLVDWLGVAELPRPLVVVAGILSDKDWQGMLVQLGTAADALVLTIASSAPESRRWSLDGVQGWLTEREMRPSRAIADLAAAVERATTMAPHGTVVITGSVHTVGDAMQHLGIPLSMDDA